MRPGSLRAAADGVPLRVKLVAALLGLSTLVLLAYGAASALVLRDYLIDRVDRQLVDTAKPMITDLADGRVRIPEQVPGRKGLSVPTQYLVQIQDPAGGVLARPTVDTGQLIDPELDLPTIDMDRVLAAGGEPFTTTSRVTGQQWRVILAPARDLRVSVALALPLRDVNETVGRLARVNLVLGLLALALLAVLGSALVRSSLRPLVEVEQTAAAIAGGDLASRVPDHDPRTEVGRLTRTLNGMLAQIEDAFAARTASEGAALASEDRMRRFVADASHELRTPLTSIRGFAELYRQGAVPPDEVPGVLSRMEAEATRMGLLVDDLLLLAHLDQQRPLQKTPVELEPMARDVVEAATALAPDHALSIEVLPGPPPVVNGDESRLRQVLTNLITNATRHTPAGTSVTVTIGVSSGGGASGDVAVMQVADTGPGMTEEQAERAFERFYRADTARTRASGGSGLGLSIVSALVTAHGGTIALKTAPSEGATFRVELPLAG